MANVPLPLETLRAAFNELKRTVTVDLNTQRGDAARLGERKRQCLQISQLFHQHSHLFVLEERTAITDSIERMIQSLDDATHRSADPADTPFFAATTTLRTGRPGRPRIIIDPELLAVTYSLRGPTHLGSTFGVHPRTVRRQALEMGLVEPAEPVYVDYEQADGSVARLYRSSSGAVSNIEDGELDNIVQYILQSFPGFGRRMIDGHLKFLGHTIPRKRIQRSYARVNGAAPIGFGPRHIQRRVYNVPGPNSLWHHDGQHGLIRWKFVIHAFVDGFSRLVTAIQVSSNNTSQTVLDLFIEATEVHGVPSRVRGDYGTENLLVASVMEELKGVDRGSYIWGRLVILPDHTVAVLIHGTDRSVHNVRIERLWRDVTLGFGIKWKRFFQSLEVHDGLNPNLEAHIWLLHHLFSVTLNDDACNWAEAWNAHVLSIRGERQRSPKDMFVFGMMDNGMRGLGAQVESNDEPLDAAAVLEYGIDWEVYDDIELRNHHNTYNREDELGPNPFLTHQPQHLSHVAVDTPDCPFDSAEGIAALDRIIAGLDCGHNMDAHRLRWIVALEFSTQHFANLA